MKRLPLNSSLANDVLHARLKAWNELPTELHGLTDHRASDANWRHFMFEHAFTTSDSLATGHLGVSDGQSASESEYDSFMYKKRLFTRKMNLELKKRITRCLIWSVAL